jgi:alanine dehydrogenase
MGNQFKSEVATLAKKSSLQPQEALLRHKPKSQSLFIGIPKEIAMVENRVALTPEAVALLVNNGHQVWVENNAGKTSKFSDREYSEAGVMLIAAEYLSSANDGKGVILGGVTGVPPTKVVILGAGTVAEYAARAALGLGAEIQIFDNHIYKLRRIKHALGQQVYTSSIDNVTLRHSLKNADVVIGAIRAEKGRSRCIVTEEMVAEMQEDSIIIDVSIDQGGCFETSEMTTQLKPTYRRHGVIHYCVPNIPSRVARTATTAISNIFTPVLLQIANAGGVEDMIFTTKWFTKGVYTYKGSLTNANIANKFNLKYKDLTLLLAARF